MKDRADIVSGVREGDLIAGKYRVERILGSGGMGVVVAARHEQLDTRVAIKFLLPPALESGEAVARFAREARAAVRIQSEHVARVSDVGTLENGAPYMVMEYLEGSDLSTWVQQRRLSIEQATEFILQACEAIAEAHALGIVHRDLKPANLFAIRRADGSLSVKVLDFGISKAMGLGVSEASVTKTSAIMGSPLYMSPEQMQSSKDVDGRSDIWALGVILHELLTGTPPFIADTMPELVLRIASAPPEPLRSKLPNAPEALETVILRCLDKDRGKRFQNVAEFALALQQFGPKRAMLSVERISGVLRAAGLEGTALVLPPSSEPTEPISHTGTVASWGQTTPPKRSRGAALLVVAATAAAAVVAGLAMRSRPGHEGETTARTPATPSVTMASASGVPSATEPKTTRAVVPTVTAAPVGVESMAAEAKPPSVVPVQPRVDEQARASGAHPTKSRVSKQGMLPATSALPADAMSTAKPGTSLPKPPASPTTPSVASTASHPGANIFDDRK